MTGPAESKVTPLPIPPGASGVVLFGGVFDPPHAWHTAVAGAVRRALFPREGWIVLVPAARSPLKEQGPVASDPDRLEMLRLAVGRMPRVIVWTDEIDRADAGTPSYTIDTLERAARVVPPGVPMRLLIGADQAAQFHRWKDFRRIMELAEPVVVRRPPLDREDRFRAAMRAAGAWTDAEIDAWVDRIIPCHVHGMSSTRIREVLHERRDRSLASDLRAWVKAPVLRYIEERGLYR